MIINTTKHKTYSNSFLILFFYYLFKKIKCKFFCIEIIDIVYINTQILAGKENLGIGALIEYTLSTFSKIKFQNGVFIAMP